jgi:hypothetical protein
MAMVVTAMTESVAQLRVEVALIFGDHPKRV